eukprot:11138594-Karenia_brevis.AAC.1
MEFAKKMIMKQKAELMADRHLAPPVGICSDIPPTLIKGNRLVIINQIVQTHALTGSILTYLEDLRAQKEKQAYEEYVKAAAKKPKEPRKKTDAETMLISVNIIL